MPYLRPWTVLLPLVLIAATATSQQPPRFELSPDTVLMDEPFRVAVAGLKPAQEITIGLDSPAGVRRSSATFRADASGRVDVADPMKFVWSATAQGPPAAAVAGDTQP